MIPVALINTSLIAFLVVLLLLFISYVWRIVETIVYGLSFKRHDPHTFFAPFYPLLTRPFRELASPQYVASLAILRGDVPEASPSDTLNRTFSQDRSDRRRALLLAQQKEKEQAEEERLRRLQDSGGAESTGEDGVVLVGDGSSNSERGSRQVSDNALAGDRTDSGVLLPLSDSALSSPLTSDRQQQQQQRRGSPLSSGQGNKMSAYLNGFLEASGATSANSGSTGGGGASSSGSQSRTESSRSPRKPSRSPSSSDKRKKRKSGDSVHTGSPDEEGGVSHGEKAAQGPSRNTDKKRAGGSRRASGTPKEVSLQMHDNTAAASGGGASATTEGKGKAKKKGAPVLGLFLPAELSPQPQQRVQLRQKRIKVDLLPTHTEATTHESCSSFAGQLRSGGSSCYSSPSASQTPSLLPRLLQHPTNPLTDGPVEEQPQLEASARLHSGHVTIPSPVVDHDEAGRLARALIGSALRYDRERGGTTAVVTDDADGANTAEKPPEHSLLDGELLVAEVAARVGAEYAAKGQGREGTQEGLVNGYVGSLLQAVAERARVYAQHTYASDGSGSEHLAQRQRQLQEMALSSERVHELRQMVIQRVSAGAMLVSHTLWESLRVNAVQPRYTSLVLSSELRAARQVMFSRGAARPPVVAATPSSLASGGSGDQGSRDPAVAQEWRALLPPTKTKDLRGRDRRGIDSPIPESDTSLSPEPSAFLLASHTHRASTTATSRRRSSDNSSAFNSPTKRHHTATSRSSRHMDSITSPNKRRRDSVSSMHTAQGSGTYLLGEDSRPYYETRDGPNNSSDDAVESESSRDGGDAQVWTTAPGGADAYAAQSPGALSSAQEFLAASAIADNNRRAGFAVAAASFAANYQPPFPSGAANSGGGSVSGRSGPGHGALKRQPTLTYIDDQASLTETHTATGGRRRRGGRGPHRPNPGPSSSSVSGRRGSGAQQLHLPPSPSPSAGRQAGKGGGSQRRGGAALPSGAEAFLALSSGRDTASLAAPTRTDLRVAYIIGADRTSLLRAATVHATRTFVHGSVNFVCFYTHADERRAVRRRMTRLDRQHRRELGLLSAATAAPASTHGTGAPGGAAGPDGNGLNATTVRQSASSPPSPPPSQTLVPRQGPVLPQSLTGDTSVDSWDQRRRMNAYLQQSSSSFTKLSRASSSAFHTTTKSTTTTSSNSRERGGAKEEPDSAAVLPYALVRPGRLSTLAARVGDKSGSNGLGTSPPIHDDTDEEEDEASAMTLLREHTSSFHSNHGGHRSSTNGVFTQDDSNADEVNGLGSGEGHSDDAHTRKPSPREPWNGSESGGDNLRTLPSMATSQTHAGDDHDDPDATFLSAMSDPDEDATADIEGEGRLGRPHDAGEERRSSTTSRASPEGLVGGVPPSSSSPPLVPGDGSAVTGVLLPTTADSCGEDPLSPGSANSLTVPFSSAPRTACLGGRGDNPGDANLPTPVTRSALEQITIEIDHPAPTPVAKKEEEEKKKGKNGGGTSVVEATATATPPPAPQWQRSETEHPLQNPNEQGLYRAPLGVSLPQQTYLIVDPALTTEQTLRQQQQQRQAQQARSGSGSSNALGHPSLTTTTTITPPGITISLSSQPPPSPPTPTGKKSTQTTQTGSPMERKSPKQQTPTTPMATSLPLPVASTGAAAVASGVAGGGEHGRTKKRSLRKGPKLAPSLRDPKLMESATGPGEVEVSELALDALRGRVGAFIRSPLPDSLSGDDDDEDSERDSHTDDGTATTATGSTENSCSPSSASTDSNAGSRSADGSYSVTSSSDGDGDDSYSSSSLSGSTYSSDSDDSGRRRQKTYSRRNKRRSRKQRSSRKTRGDEGRRSRATAVSSSRASGAAASGQRGSSNKKKQRSGAKRGGGGGGEGKRDAHRRSSQRVRRQRQRQQRRRRARRRRRLHKRVLADPLFASLPVALAVMFFVSTPQVEVVPFSLPAPPRAADGAAAGPHARRAAVQRVNSLHRADSLRRGPRPSFRGGCGPNDEEDASEMSLVSVVARSQQQQQQQQQQPASRRCCVTLIYGATQVVVANAIEQARHDAALAEQERREEQREAAMDDDDDYSDDRDRSATAVPHSRTYTEFHTLWDSFTHTVTAPGESHNSRLSRERADWSPAVSDSDTGVFHHRRNSSYSSTLDTTSIYRPRRDPTQHRRQAVAASLRYDLSRAAEEEAEDGDANSSMQFASPLDSYYPGSPHRHYTHNNSSGDHRDHGSTGTGPTTNTANDAPASTSPPHLAVQQQLMSSSGDAGKGHTHSWGATNERVEEAAAVAHSSAQSITFAPEIALFSEDEDEDETDTIHHSSSRKRRSGAAATGATAPAVAASAPGEGRGRDQRKPASSALASPPPIDAGGGGGGGGLHDQPTDPRRDKLAPIVDSRRFPDGLSVPVSLHYVRIGDSLYMVTEVIDRTFIQYRERRVLNLHKGEATGDGGGVGGGTDADTDVGDDPEPGFSGALSSNTSFHSIFDSFEDNPVLQQQRLAADRQKKKSRRRHAAVSTMGFGDLTYSFAPPAAPPEPGVQRQLVHMCWHCLSQEARAIFLPCGHYATCEACAEQLSDCCVCKTKVLSVIVLDDNSTQN